MGIMVGIGTVLADDPMLNCRVAEGADPVRIVCDSHLRIPQECQLVRTAHEIPTIVACTENTFESPGQQDRIRSLRDAGVQIIPTSGAHGVNLRALMKELGAKKIDSVLLEGGGTLNSSALSEGIVSKVCAYISGRLIGGMDAPTPVSGVGANRMSEAVHLKDMQIECLEEDFLISGYPVYEE